MTRRLKSETLKISVENSKTWKNTVNEGQNVWRCRPAGDEKDVFWWRWVPMSNVWSHEKTHTRCIDEPSGKYHRCIAEYSAMHRLTVNDELLKSATVGDPSACHRQISAMHRGVMVMS